MRRPALMLTILLWLLPAAACGNASPPSSSSTPVPSLAPPSSCGNSPDDQCVLSAGPDNSVTLGTAPSCGATGSADQLDTGGQGAGSAGLGHTLATPVANPVSGITSTEASPSSADLSGIGGSIGTQTTTAC